MGMQTGAQVSTVCDSRQNSNQGCGVRVGNGTSDQSVNDAGGAYYVLWRDFESSRSIAVYTFPRIDAQRIEALLSSPTVDPSSWGITPAANFTLPSCSDTTFGAHAIVINTAVRLTSSPFLASLPRSSSWATPGSSAAIWRAILRSTRPLGALRLALPSSGATAELSPRRIGTLIR